MKLAHNIAEEATVTTLKIQVSKIDSFTKNNDISCAFSKLCQRVVHVENLENKRSKIEEEIFLGNPQWMGVSQEKG